MRAAKHLIGSTRKLNTVSKSTLLSSLAYLALTVGAAGVPVSGFAATVTNLCPVERMSPGGTTAPSNLCVSGDISFSQALAADAVIGGCVAGQQVAVSLLASFELNGNNTRYDPAVWVAKDGLPIELPINGGGAQMCEVMPLTQLADGDPPPPGIPAIGDGDLDTLNFGEVCLDTVGGGGATVTDYPLNFPGGPAYDDPVVIECLAGPSGTLQISAMVTWQNSNQTTMCDGVDTTQYFIDSNRCDATTGDLPIDVLGSVTIIKSAAGAGMLPFEFSYNIDNPPVNAATANPTNPFNLLDTESEVIFGEIGTTGSATITVAEQNLPMGWSLTDISCVGDDQQAVTVNLAGGFVTIPLLYDAMDPSNSQSDITCTFTNAEASTNLTLQKEWIDGAAGDTADLDTDGVNDGMATSVATGAAGSEVDMTNTVVTVGTPGETVTFSETLGGGNTGTYTTGFACTGNANPPTYTPGSTTATLLLDAADLEVVCTFTNTRVTSSLTLRKEWVNGAAGDMADLDTDGVNDGMNTSTASGALGPEIDNVNTVVTTALSGETVTLSEVLGGGNTGTYTTSFVCTGSSNAPTYTPGNTSATLAIDAADTAIVCTYTNARVSSALTLVKEWVNGATNDTANLSITGANNDNNTSTASGAAGSEVDNVNTAMTVALSGETVTLSELLGGGNTGTYDTTFACTGNNNAPTYMTGDTSATLVINPADTNIVCTYTNSRETATLTLQKEWVNGQLNDTSLVEIAGINADSDTSTSSGAAGSEVDNVNTATTTIFSGETVFLIETLGGGNAGSYDVTFACTGNGNDPIYTPGETLAQLVVDPADTAITCTYTNTLQSATLTLRKAWVNGVLNDTADLNTDGINDGMATSTSGGVAGTEIDNTNTVVTTAIAGETVTLSEMLGGGNTGAYTTSFACTGSANMPVYNPGATSATLEIDAADTAVVCTYTNTLQTSSLTLRKQWIDGVLNDTADLSTDGVNDGMATSTSGGLAGSEVDDTNTVVTTALVGETVTLSEMLGGGNTGVYNVSFSCTGNNNPPTYMGGDTSATLLIDAADSAIVCTYTNTVQSAGLTLRKQWVDGLMNDTAMLEIVGNGMATSTASGAAGSEIDNVNTVVSTLLVGETVTLSEMLGGAGSYTTSFACTGNANTPTYTPGDTSATLEIDGADTSIVCTFTNTIQAASLTLRKEWFNGAAGDTAGLMTDGINDGNSSSLASGAAGSEVDNTNTVVTTAIVGETVSLSEMLGGGNTGSYDVSFDCTGNNNAPTYMAGDTSATLVINAADTAIVCTYTNTRATSALTLQKEWINGAFNDDSLLEIDGVNDDFDVSTASGAAGSEVDMTNTANTTALSGETVSLNETLGINNTGGYTISFDCTGNNNAPTYMAGDDSATLVIDAADTDIVCTYTNTRQSSNLTLRKEWFDGAASDMSDLSTDGVNDGNATSTATGAAGSEIDNTNTVVTIALSGETVTLSEMLGGGNTGSYDANFACTGNMNAATYMLGDTTATLEIDAADTDIVCTYTNTRQSSNLTLRKEWVNAIQDDTADLSNDGVNDGNATSTASGAAGSEVDNTNTVMTTALSGETVTMSEMFGGGNAGAYDTNFACTGNTNAVTYTLGDTSATLVIDGADADIVCTYTNTAVAPEIDLIKTVVPDSVMLQGDGSYNVQYVIEANNASDGPGVYNIIDNVAPGSGIALNSASIAYQTGVGENDQSGTVNNAYPTMVTGEGLGGQQFERWDLTVNFTVDPPSVDPMDSDCTPGSPVTGTGFYNEVSGSDTDPNPGNNQDCDGLPDPIIDLSKTLVPGSVTLEADQTYSVQFVIEANNTGDGPGFYDISDMATPGAGITLNTAMIVYQIGVGENSRTGTIVNAHPTLVTDEALAGQQFERWTLTMNFAVDPVTVDPGTSGCDPRPGDPAPGTGFYNIIVGSDTDPDPVNDEDCDGLPDPEIDLSKSITNFDDSVAGTVVVTYEITANNLGDGPGFYDLIDTVDPATGAVIVSAELVSYNAGSENSQSGTLAGALPYSFTNGELLVDDEALGGQLDESWTVVVEFDVSNVSGEFECNGAGTGTYNEVTGSDTDPDPGNNSDCGDLERLRTTFRVTKDFSDDNPAGVTVIIDCNTGLPLMQQGVVHDPEAAGLQPGDFTLIEFIVNDFEPGTMNCDIEEIIPDGYVPTYTAGTTTGAAGDIFDDELGCHYVDIEGGTFTCDIFNQLQPVEVVVEKEWIDDNPQFVGQTFVEVTLQCDGPIDGGYPCLESRGDNGNYCIDTFIDPDNPGVFDVTPHFEGTTCFATEEPIIGVLTDESDCAQMVVFPGQGDSCVIVNTRLYAGIPTLSQYGLLLLVLMMFGVGAVAYRRFV